jgi:hypothetical protein
LRKNGTKPVIALSAKCSTELVYGLQGDKKTLTVTESHVDRDVQFEYINKRCQKANVKGIPVISIDAKKKENIGNFKNNGKTYQPQSNPIQVLDHDFPILKNWGKLRPSECIIFSGIKVL